MEKGSLLESIAGSERIQVNSYHHQSLKDVPPVFKVTGVASDGIIEAIESTDKQFVFGVQWHPEALSAAKGMLFPYEFLKDLLVRVLTKENKVSMICKNNRKAELAQLFLFK